MPLQLRARVAGLFVTLGGLAILVFTAWPWLRSLAGPAAPPPTPAQAWPYRFPVAKSDANDREIAFYLKKVKERPNSAPDHASLASAYLKQARLTLEPGWYLLAEKSARASLAHQPVDNRAAVLVLARVAEARHDFREALALLDSIGADRDDTLAVRVTSLLALGDVGAAATCADELVRQAPTPSSYGLLALVRIARGDDGGAVEAFERALSREEAGEAYTSAWLRVMFGRFSGRRGRLALARDLQGEALRIMPEYPLALAGLADLEMMAGDLVSADRLYDRAWARSQQPAWQLARARIMAAQGNTSAARAVLEDTRKRLEAQLSGGAFGHRRDLARLYLERKDPGDAQRAVALMQQETALRRDAETLDVQAASLMAAGRPAEALQAERDALRWGLRDAEMQRRLGEIEQALGHGEEAREAAAASRRINPALR